MRHFFAMLGLLLLMSGAVAAELATPDGEVLLTISGNIGLSNSENGAEFDLAMLEQLGAESITTRTPWTDGPTLFTGVRLNVLLDAVMARSHSFRALAIDDYWFDFNDIDIEKYPIIVSYKQNDSLMTARNLGPLWIMFPFDDYPELLSEVNKAACVWQLNSLVVR